jgi:hypothetical protein
LIRHNPGARMGRLAELVARVRDDAATISDLVTKGTNVPLEDYIDKASLNALCDSVGLDPENWQSDDLERILIIRDGLYELRNKLRDLSDDSEHSVEQLLSATDRLYADLERAFRELNQDDLLKAQNEIAALRRGPHIDPTTLVPRNTAEIRRGADEVITQGHTSLKHIEYNFLKINNMNVNFELLRNAKIIVHRLSASAFAIKLSLETKVVFEGVFKLLHDGADRFLEELKKLLGTMKSSYDSASTLMKELSKLAETGSRFARLTAEYLSKALTCPCNLLSKPRQLSALRGSPTLTFS